jgi:F-type H+-transporting ATPase subunit delta
MKTSKQAMRDAKQLFTRCKVNGVLDENCVRQAVRLVASRKPRGYAGILSHFYRLVKADRDRHTARVESAVAMADSLQSAIKASLTRRYGAGLDISFGVNPQLIGGMRVKVSSDVYDGSVRGRLNELAESF